MLALTTPSPDTYTVQSPSPDPLLTLLLPEYLESEGRELTVQLSSLSSSTMLATAGRQAQEGRQGVTQVRQHAKPSGPVVGRQCLLVACAHHG